MPGTRSAVLIVLTATLLAAGCGGSDDAGVTVTETATTTATTSTSTATEPGTTATTTTGSDDGSTPSADQTVTKLTGFTSPTGNIGCYIDKRSVRCDISERDWEPPPAPSGCDLDYGQGIELQAGGSADFVCAGDTALGGGDALDYGTSIGAGLLICESEESGMTCTDAETGRGFTISREGYDIF